jgi:outer membrane protein assembly factor BamB
MTPNNHENDHKYRTALWTAGVAGVLAFVISALLIYDFSRRTAKDPLESATFAAFRNTLKQQPTNEELKQQIRTIDLELRREAFRQKVFAATGGGFLLINVAIFLLAVRTATTLRRRLPQPEPLVTLEDRETRWTGLALGGVAVLAIGLTIGVLILSFTSRSPLPGTDAELTAMLVESKKPPVAPPSGEKPLTKAVVANDIPSDEEIAQAWPTFRGPGGRGVSAFDNIPTEWSVAEGKEINLRWKSAVPLPGNNSPIVWKDRVFLSGADANRREVYCFDAKSGKLLWQKEVLSPQNSAKLERQPDAGYAAPTMATDGRRVFAIFANGDLAAFDFEGNLAWSKSLGLPDSHYGYSSSLTMFKNLLLVQHDQGFDKDPASKILAFDSAAGEIVWQTERKVPNSWASPIVIRAGNRDQVVTVADPWVIAYNPADGKELWRANCLKGDIGPSPTFAANTIFTANDGAKLSAIPADGEGDITKKILWQGEDGMPDTCSVLASEQYVLLWDSSATLNCYDAEKGNMLWDESFDDPGYSSPSFVGKRVYLFATKGKSLVVEPTKEKCERIAENDLGEECVTSPAFQNGCFYIRGKDHLFCIGEK